MTSDAPPGPSDGSPSADDGWDEARITRTRNTARYFVENRSIAWILMVSVVFWGLYGYVSMPKQKDPTIPVRVAVAETQWPGVDAQRVELLVTRPIEEKIAENSTIYPSTPSDFGIQSISLPGLSLVQVQLDDRIDDVETELNDIDLRLRGLNDSLPEGAGPIEWNSGFGETAALMLTIASPPEREPALAVRAQSLRGQLEQFRAEATRPGERMSLVVMLPRGGDSTRLDVELRVVARRLEESGVHDVRPLVGPGFAVLDVATELSEADFLELAFGIARKEFDVLSFHPDAWDPVAVRDLGTLQERLAAVVGPRFTYRELDDFSDLVARQIQAAPQVSKVLRSGVLKERIEFSYSQDDLAQRGVTPYQIARTLSERNEVLAGGRIPAERSEIVVSPSGDFRTVAEIENVMVTRGDAGPPLVLSQLGDLVRGYQDPPSVLNYYRSKTPDGRWMRSPAVTLAVQMRDGEQIAEFSREVDALLDDLRSRLPEDLVMARTSDQPRQVKENIDLFMGALGEAIVLVVVVALIGFRDWRSSLLLMISIPLTLAMTFGAVSIMGVKLHQISIATLIIALGLLVDDPVVASDAIKRDLSDGHKRLVAAWLGPTKLARAILFATITNVAAYLPFLLLTGQTGTFLWSLPVVMATALISSRIVSMTFIPFLAYYILRAPSRPEPTMEERRTQGATGRYYRFVRSCLEHRYKVLAVAVALMLGGFSLGSRLVGAYFPNDVQYLFTVDIWAPTAFGVPATDEIADRVEVEIQAGLEALREKGEMLGELVSITSFVGSGGPRFWQTISPELPQAHYAQLIIEVSDKDDTPHVVPRLQERVAKVVPGAWIDVKELELNPVSMPVAMLLSYHGDPGDLRSQADFAALRSQADRLVALVRGAPSIERVRHDWLDERMRLRVDVDPDRANLSAVSNLDVSRAVQAAYDGAPVSSLHEGDESIPVTLRMRRWERPTADAVPSLYVYPEEGGDAVPLGAIASLESSLATEKIRRREHFRTATVYGFPKEGRLPSQVIGELASDLEDFEASLPPGFRMQIGGEKYKQQSGFANMRLVLAVSAIGIFIALVFQLSSLIKPWIVFAGVPFGFAGGLTALFLTGEPFGFMAFLGLVSLVGVIVSHVIVLNDFIEEMLARGEPLMDSLLDAGLLRLRPVLITVSATVIALIPLARDGGPLWGPLCYAQIGGLTVATAISLLIVPVLYAICALDLGIIEVKNKGVEEAGAVG